MRINKKFTIIILISLIFITACTTSYKTTTTTPDLRIGFYGMTLEFLKGSPPVKIFEGDSFPVTIKVKNNGAYSIKESNPAVISLGVEKDYTKNVKLEQYSGTSIPIYGSYAFEEQNAHFVIGGRTQINPRGGEEIIIYKLEAGKIDPKSEAHLSTVIATLCYPYETILDSTICVDTDINNLRPIKKVCNMQDLIFNNGQGAPVAITKIEMNMLPTETLEKITPQFLIYVENKGNGLVIKNEAVFDYCIRSETKHEDLNIVYVDAYLSGKRLNCQLEKIEELSPIEFGTKEIDSDKLGHIKLKDKKDIIRCALKEGIDRNQDPYLSPLKIRLWYGYTQSISASYFIEGILK